MGSEKKRRINFTEHEKALLLRVISKYYSIVENKSTKNVVNTKKNEVWEKILVQFNSQSLSGPRTVRQLRVLYDNLKRMRGKDNQYEKRLIMLAKPNGLNEQIDQIKTEPEDVSVITNVTSLSNDDDLLLPELQKPTTPHNLETPPFSHCNQPTVTKAVVVPGCSYYPNIPNFGPVFVDTPKSVPEQSPVEPEKVPTRFKRRINSNSDSYNKSRFTEKSLRRRFLNQKIRKGALKCRLMALEAQKVSLEMSCLRERHSLEIEKLRLELNRLKQII